MLKKLAGTALTAAALIAAAAIAPATAHAAPIAVTPGSEVIVVHSDGTPTVQRASGVTRHPDNHPASPDGDRCTLGFVFQGSDGEPRALIAAHCGDVHEEIRTPDGRTIGRIADAAEYSDAPNSPDTALVSFNPGVVVDSRIAGLGPVRGTISPEDIKRTNPILCKLGAVTGMSCGPVDFDTPAPDGFLTVHAQRAGGDSGGPMWTFGEHGEVLAVGTHSGGPGGRMDRSFVESVDTYLRTWDLKV